MELVAVSLNGWAEVKVVAVLEHIVVNYEMAVGEVEMELVVVSWNCWAEVKVVVVVEHIVVNYEMVTGEV